MSFQLFSILIYLVWPHGSPECTDTSFLSCSLFNSAAWDIFLQMQTWKINLLDLIIQKSFFAGVHVCKIILSCGWLYSLPSRLSYSSSDIISKSSCADKPALDICIAFIPTALLRTVFHFSNRFPVRIFFRRIHVGYWYASTSHVL